MMIRKLDENGEVATFDPAADLIQCRCTTVWTEQILDEMVRCFNE
ncbi:MAG TPA: hypothetical protein VGF79_08575 [Bacteroidia bacterium]